MVTGSKELIRDINTTLVTKAIINKGPISRASIAKELGLTKATVSNIVQLLEDRNLVEELGPAETAFGRKPITLQFRHDCGYVISIDLSATHITILTATLGGKNCAIKQYANDNQGDTIIATLISLIASHLKTIPSCPYNVVGISLGIHGVIHNNKVKFTPYSPYASIDFATPLKEHFHLPVLIDNEANLSILGEYSFCYPRENMIGISVHSGIGLGIIINNELYDGSNGYAGEFGHSIIAIDGRPCPCGNNGCFEQYASERSLLGELAVRKSCKEITADEFVILYQQQDPDAIYIMQSFIKYMSIGINNILNTMNPELIVINSSFTMNFPNVIVEIEHSIKNQIHQFCDLVPSGLQDMSILLGGVCKVRKLFLNI